MSDKKTVKISHYINYAVIALAAVVLGSLSLAGALPASYQIIFENIAISITLAVSLSMVVGFLGELSLGHAGFMCVGSYLGGKTVYLLAPSIGDIPALLIGFVVGGTLAAVCGIIIGLPALRLRGDYLAIVTLAFGEIVWSIFMNTSEESFGGALGMPTVRIDKDYLFIIALIVVLLCLAVTQNLIRSKHGRAITSIRDNEIASRATGINVTKYKLSVFAISAFFAGVAGVLLASSNYTVQSQKFNYNYSIEILVMVVLGGMGNINGSIIAAALITFLDIKLQTVLTGDAAVLQDLVYALILIVIVIYNNAPGLKAFRETHNLKSSLARFHRPKDASHVSDDEAKWDRVPTKIRMDEVLSVDVQVKSPYTPDKSEKGDSHE